jgi:hypothetical protein
LLFTWQKQFVATSFAEKEDWLCISDIIFMETLAYAFPDLAEKTEMESLLSVLKRISTKYLNSIQEFD